MLFRKDIYLDNGATTKVDSKVVKRMQEYFSEKYGNASSLHSYGRDAKENLENARKIIAKSIGAKTKEIIFTSGGTESNNLAIKGVALFYGKGHIIVSKVEHKCILNSCKWLEGQGFEITYLDVDNEGFIDLEHLKKSIKKDTILVSIIHGNNEIGTINNLEEIGKICRERKVYFHTDACQSYTKTEINVEKQNLDLVTLNSHKIHGPKGVGALFVKEGIKLTPLNHGGGQEGGVRGGTENVAGIIGFAEAVKIASDKNHIKKMERLRNKLIEEILKIPESKLNGSRKNRLCNNLNFSFKKVEGEAIGGYLDQKGITSSTGSACSEASLQPSYVLKSIGLSDELANGSLRLTLSRFTTEEEIDYVAKVLPKIISKLRKFSPL
jgi:cysteine desulfurase